jgi:tetratricopeptide (TPR) repeat protein
VTASPARQFAASVEEPFYYLHNFEAVTNWVHSRYADLLLPAELDLIDAFPSLPRATRALLVRMIMRKGMLFRASKLDYAEIGPVETAVLPLLAQGWVEADPALDLTQLFALLTRTELAAAFGDRLPRTGRKSDWLAALEPQFPGPRRLGEWCGANIDAIYFLALTPLCDRIRLLFFGNLHQNWSEFVLADLGIHRYEQVEFSAAARAFRTRTDVDDYLRINDCRERLEAGESAEQIAETLSLIETDNAWIDRRRAKALFRTGQCCERNQELESALAIYEHCVYPGARARRIRVLERLRRIEQALALCEDAIRNPESEDEAQQLQRMLPRLQRRAGGPAQRRGGAPAHVRVDLTLPRPTVPFYVEDVVQAHLHRDDAPVHYVENTLINSLFGLLCWEAIFAAVPGAFFHPFQKGPADLLSPDFRGARGAAFEQLLAQLDTGDYLHTIRHAWRSKYGIQSPFVYWSALDESILEQALSCLPAAHLRKLFERLLADIESNRAGLPDLIQLWPEQRGYRMIEVKGPGDRLQDNQLRWLDYCGRHDIPVAVCYVQWQEPAQ